MTWASGRSLTLDCHLRGLHRPKLGPVNVGDHCVAGAVCGATDSGTRIYPYCLNWIFGVHFLWRATLLSLDNGGEGLGLASKWCARLCRHHIGSFTLSEQGMGAEVDENWGSKGKERSGNRNWYVKWEKTVLKTK